MNAVVAAVAVMLILSLCRVHVVVALILGAVTGGLLGGLDLEATLSAFQAGLGKGANVALSYALLGAFAVAIARSGLAHALAERARGLVERQRDGQGVLKLSLLGVLLVVAMSSQNLVPIHIAFIPLLVPPLLYVMGRLRLDRRLVACVLTFGLITPYMFFPVGFGGIFLNDILLANVVESGGEIDGVNVMQAMALPALGMLIGLLVAMFISYRRPRDYAEVAIEGGATGHSVQPNRFALLVALVAVASAFVVQLWLDSMIMGALLGFVLFSVSGVVRWREADGVFTEGMKMMAMIGFIMIAAAGFAEVMRATGSIQTLVDSSAELIGGNRAMAALLMLLVGLLITMGIGSSFSTIPIIAAIYVPLALQLGFSPLAIVALVGTAAALGDAGSPASDSTLGPTAGLNADGQHNHIWDTVVPTFLHYNLPLLAFGWLAVMVL
ncbi:Na+/H+ antiporter family protein [Pseudomonas sp.]|uniref:Na+/H+ antiporter family protein n=1 Tax=Pseudomonas sp. TaxID=306 RepID=UPI00272BBEAC|nr:Na+/H+ antiporter NhaC family protein [Pseudomonas sp.]